MDTTRFDALTRTLSRAPTRRSALQTLLALAATLSLGAIDTPETSGKSKKPECRQPGDCRKPTNPCKKATCERHKCEAKKRPNGTRCNGGRCCGGACCRRCCARGTCKSGDTKEFCGTGGRACDTCTGDEVCTPDGCVTPPCGEPGGPCRVFVASTIFSGDFNGLDGANATCQAFADGADLNGSFRAWLSTSGSSPSTDATFTKASGPYRLLDGTKIADGWDDLIDGSLQAPINITQAGEELAGQHSVWTGTKADGTAETNNCFGWQSSEMDVYGGVGATDQTDDGWTSLGLIACQFPQPKLYCFEQQQA
jgi:hypothetical protein